MFLSDALIVLVILSTAFGSFNITDRTCSKPNVQNGNLRSKVIMVCTSFMEVLSDSTLLLLAC